MIGFELRKNTLQAGSDPGFRLEPREDTAAVVRKVHVHASGFAGPGIDIAHEVPMHLAKTGGSHRQIETIADEIEEKLKEAKRKPSHVEGYPRGDWILMDYVDFVVHVFTPASRSYYDLERLWGDAKRLAVVS